MFITFNKYGSDASYDLFFIGGLSEKFDSNMPMLGLGRSSTFYYNQYPLKFTFGYLHCFSQSQQKDFTISFQRRDVNMALNNSRYLYLPKAGVSYYPLWESRTFLNPFINISGGVNFYENNFDGSNGDYVLKGLYTDDARKLNSLGILGEGRIGVEINLSALSPWIRQSDFIIQLTLANTFASPMTVAHLSNELPENSDKMMYGEFENEETEELVTKYIGYTQSSSIRFNGFNISLIWRYRD